MLHVLLLLSFSIVACDNLTLLLNKIQALGGPLKASAHNGSYLENKKILSEILIDLGDNVIFSNEAVKSTQRSTNSLSKEFIKNATINITTTTTKLKNVVSTQKLTLNATTLAALRSLKNRDVRFFFKSKNESNKFLKASKNEHAVFSIDNVYENKMNFMVIKINKELLVLIASVSSLFLIAFTVITFLYKCINFSSNRNATGYHQCRCH